MSQQPNIKYRFYASLLDAFTEFLDVKAEEFFYKDENGDWHMNMNQEGELHYSEEEVYDLAKQELIDKINRVDQGPSEAADKGTAFNEIVDCIVLGKRSTRDDVKIRLLKEYDEVREVGSVSLADGKPDYYDYWVEKVKQPCLYAGINGFSFYFDIQFAKDAAKYFKGSVCQLLTSAPIETKYGVVELYGYPDYIKENKVYDMKTTKQYQWGKYERKWQKHVYPYTLITSGKCTEVHEFEYTCFKLSGGSSRTPLITGQMFPEVYTFDYETSKRMLQQQCERLIEFLEQNKELITDKKIFNEL